MNQKIPLFVLSATALGWLSSIPSAMADYVTINSVNGGAQTSVVDVRPGDVVYLTGQSNEGAALVWSANDIPGGRDECIVVPDSSDADGASCLSESHFEANSTGVAFYVPYDAPAEITVSAHSSRDGSAIDSVILRNSITSVDPSYTAPTQVISDPQNYTSNSFNADTALAGHGRWVMISGQRHFVPYAYRENWVPYQNGNWVMADNEYTWVSYDPWGWMTDHYGTWRHHTTYGWIWAPFSDMRYRPHTVTFFHHNSGYVGWYPYYNGYNYALGESAGFNDYYWSGYNAGSYYSYGGRYNPGFTVVRSGAFLSSNCYDARVVDLSFGYGIWSSSYRANWYGRYPGGNDLYSSRTYIERGCGRSIPVTTIYSRNYAGGAVFRYPVGVHSVPSVYRELPYAGSLRRPYPVGTVFPGAGRGPVYRPLPSPVYSGSRGTVYAPAPSVYRPAPVARPIPPMGRVTPPSVVRPAPGPVFTPPVARPLPPVVRPAPPVVRPAPPVVRPAPPFVRPAPAGPVFTPPVRTMPTPAAPVVRPSGPRPSGGGAVIRGGGGGGSRGGRPPRAF